jgi:hypothetical protein
MVAINMHLMHLVQTMIQTTMLTIQVVIQILQVMLEAHHQVEHLVQLDLMPLVQVVELVTLMVVQGGQAQVELLEIHTHTL